MGCGRRQFAALDCLLLSSLLACAGACYAAVAAPTRIGALGCAVAAPWAASVAGRVATARGDADEVFERAVSGFVMPPVVLGLIFLRAGLKDPEARIWLLILCRVAFGAAALSLTAVTARLFAEHAAPSTRFRRTTALVALGVLPWWLVVQGSTALDGPTAAGAVLAALPAFLGGLWAARGVEPQSAPVRHEVFQALPHLLLVTVGTYLGLTLCLVKLRAGGPGVLGATFLIAPFATRAGLSEARASVREEDGTRDVRTGWSARDSLLVLGLTPAPVIAVIQIVWGLLRGGKSLWDAVGGLIVFERENVGDEIRAGAAWLFLAVPAATVFWDASTKAAASWRRTHRDGMPERPSYYAGLLGAAAERTILSIRT